MLTSNKPARLLASFGLLALILLLLAAAYWPGLGGGFVFDDYQNIVDNPAVRVDSLSWRRIVEVAFSSSASSAQRPLAMLTFAVNHVYTGMDPWPMKLTNVLIHLFNTALVFLMLRSLFAAIAGRGDSLGSRSPEGLALFTSAWWAFNPINLMAVLYTVQRMESLSHTFVFLGLWLYVTGRVRQQSGLKGWGLVLGGLIPCTLLGLASKESAALLPLYAFIVELFVFRFADMRGAFDRRIAAMYVAGLLLPALLALAWLLPRAFAEGAFSGRDFTLAERLMTEPRAVIDYLHWTLLPDLGRMGLHHDDYVISRGMLQPVSTLIAILLILALLGFAWFRRAQTPLLSLGIAWFFSAHLLTATIINLELVYEHRNYFASLGACVFAAGVLLCLPTGRSARRAGEVLAGLLLLFGAATTYLRAKEWSEPVRFAQSEAAKHPNSPRATYDLARLLVLASKYDRKSPYIDDAWKSLEAARRVPHSGLLPDQALLLLAARSGTPIDPVWWQDARTKLREKPVGPQDLLSLSALTNCAVNDLCVFPEQEMMGLFEAGLEHGPNAGVLSIYGKYAWHVLHDPALATRLWQEACEREPGNAQFRINLALVLLDQGRYPEARIQVAKLRTLGRLGQYEDSADTLDRLIKNRSQSPAPSTSG